MMGYLIARSRPCTSARCRMDKAHCAQCRDTSLLCGCVELAAVGVAPWHLAGASMGSQGACLETSVGGVGSSVRRCHA
jgi:hypothetical protein